MKLAEGDEVSSVNIPGPDLNGPSVAAGVVMDTQTKYNSERDKRLRADGIAQFITPEHSDKYRHFLDDPWVTDGTPVNHAPLENGKTKFLLVGAGIGGILYAVKLIQAGFKAEDLVIVDPAGGFGGTWYWNRYPGLACDVESYVYLPLIEDTGYMPKHKYSTGHEIRTYLESVGEQYGLYPRTVFQTSVDELKWSGGHWDVKLTEKPKDGEHTTVALEANYVLFASGPFGKAHLPNLPGFDDFKGPTFHTARWDYIITGGTQEDPALTSLKDKRVAIIGTGASAVQSVPFLSQWAKELFVVQRTPSGVMSRDDKVTDPELFKNDIAGKKGWWKARNENLNLCLCDERPEVDLCNDGFSHARSMSAIVGSTKVVTMDTMADHVKYLNEIDLPRQEGIRKQTLEIVKDLDTARRLQAWYPTWCKRACFNDDYLPSFNKSNVHLVDTEGRGVDRITEKGVVVNGKEYEVDILIHGTGFTSPFIGSPAGKAGITVTGPNGVVLEDRNTAGELSTLHGITANGFPNLYWPGPMQGFLSANQTFVLDTMAAHIAKTIATAEEMKGTEVVIEAEAEAVEKWANVILEHAPKSAAMGGCTPGYFNLEGLMDKMTPEVRAKMARQGLFGGGPAMFTQILADWEAQGDLEGLSVQALAA